MEGVPTKTKTLGRATLILHGFYFYHAGSVDF